MARPDTDAESSPPAPRSGAGGPRRGLSRVLADHLPLAALAAGLWAMLPRYLGPPLSTSDRVEIADHVVPGIVVLVASMAALVVNRRSSRDNFFHLAAAFAVGLAGFWMTATHAPLVVQAIRQEAPWDATAFHTAPGLAVLGVGLLWAAVRWSADDRS